MLHHLNGELYLATYKRIPIISAQIIKFKIIHAHLPFMLSRSTCELGFQCNMVPFYSAVYDQQPNSKQVPFIDHDILNAYCVYTTPPPPKMPLLTFLT